MTGPEHYRRAEAVLDEMARNPGAVARGANDGVSILTDLAQAHATLALAAATALTGWTANEAQRNRELAAWHEVAGTPVPGRGTTATGGTCPGGC